MLPNIQFFDATKITTLFGYIKSILYIVMPILMIYAAIHLSDHLIDAVKGAFIKKDDDERLDDKNYD